MYKRYSINALCLGKNDSLCIEIQGARLKKGKGEITVTGNLGTTAYETMILARNILYMSYDKFGQYDYHLHFAYPSTKKDGTSWGLACYLLLSFLSGYLYYIPNIAATGELDLFGNILPINYIDDKLAAWSKSKCEFLLIPANHVVPKILGVYQVSSLQEVNNILKNIISK